jgi:hypothetical protein
MARPLLAAGFALALLVACGALPSGVPLANSGGVLEDTGTDRDRRPHPVEGSFVGLGESKPAAAISARAAAPVPTETAPDAGAAPAGVAPTDAGVGTMAWAGEYYGSDKLARHFDGEADDVELDDKAHTRIEERTAGALVISIVNSATSDVICALHATAHGAQATLDSGQSCFGDDGSTATVTEGHVSLNADRLTLDFAGRVVENEADDDDAEPAEFRLDYHFEGRRR